MADLTKENLEQELKKDLAELAGKKSSKKKTTSKTVKKEVKKKETKKKVAAKKESKKKATKKAEKKMDKTEKKVEAKDTPKETVTKPEPQPNTTDNIDHKKIEEQNQEDEIRSKRIFYGGIAAIIILFCALLIGGQYLPGSGGASQETLEYNGFTFVKDSTHWIFEWQKDNTVYTIPLRFNPEEAEQVNVEGVLDPRFNKLSPIYITFDPTSEESNFTYLTLGAGELSFNLVQALGKEIEPACAADDGTEVCENRTIVNCDNSEGKAVMYLQTGEPAGVTIDGTCIVMRGEGMELLRSIDRVLYNWYGVMR